MAYLSDVLVVACTFSLTLLVVFLHYQASARLNEGVLYASSNLHKRILVMMLGLLCVHIVEIWLFGIASWLLLMWPETGSIVHSQLPHATLTFLDHIYFSTVTYSTLGYGEMYPLGAIRFLFGVESLVGFLMITWSASLTFVEMQRHWR